MNLEDLISLYPRLYHMAEDGSWPSIQAHGLLSTRRLLDLYEINGDRRKQVLANRRPESVEICHPIHGRAVVRDQKPLHEKKLEGCLVGLTVTEWLETLNGRVFFWLQEGRLGRMLGAPPYRERPHTVLIADTASLIDTHRERVRLSRINTGATLFNAPARGPETFEEIEAYDHPNRRSASAGCGDIAELSVLDGVPDITDFIVRVERRQAELGVIEVVWERV